ncbi:uncharacterized protein V1510DRAFT_413921 [Dipodascopsis tothii]|uniref:uncharacterized protein n=1 Tax=Dipodascopsis tothii TaxID=44089 RepID=UPI0034CF5557
MSHLSQHHSPQLGVAQRPVLPHQHQHQHQHQHLHADAAAGGQHGLHQLPHGLHQLPHHQHQLPHQHQLSHHQHQLRQLQSEHMQQFHLPSHFSTSDVLTSATAVLGSSSPHPNPAASPNMSIVSTASTASSASSTSVSSAASSVSTTPTSGSLSQVRSLTDFDLSPYASGHPGLTLQDSSSQCGLAGVADSRQTASGQAAGGTVHPPEDLDMSLTFPTKEALVNYLNMYANRCGFRLSRTSSRPEHIRLQCWKRSKTSKYTRTPHPEKQRSSFGATRSTGCPFFLNCWHNKKSGVWYVKSANLEHNHTFARDLISRKSLTPEEDSLLRDFSYAGADVTRAIPVKIINAKRKELGIPEVDPKLISNTLSKFRQQRAAIAGQ